MSASLRAGAALYAAGHLRAAQRVWYDGEPSVTDGLGALAAVQLHGRSGEWDSARREAMAGCQLLQDSGGESIELDPVLGYLKQVARDPEHIERVEAPRIRLDGDTITVESLDPSAAFLAAPVLADTLGFESTPIQQAVSYARSDRERSETDTRFLALVHDFVVDSANRGTVYRRLESLVDRRQTREEDVDELF